MPSLYKEKKIQHDNETAKLCVIINHDDNQFQFSFDCSKYQKDFIKSYLTLVLDQVNDNIWVHLPATSKEPPRAALLYTGQYDGGIAGKLKKATLQFSDILPEVLQLTIPKK